MLTFFIRSEITFMVSLLSSNDASWKKYKKEMIKGSHLVFMCLVSSSNAIHSTLFFYLLYYEKCDYNNIETSFFGAVC